jgi:hypothetical protein
MEGQFFGEISIDAAAHRHRPPDALRLPTDRAADDIGRRLKSQK